jgi:hypothetical protein
MKLIKEFKQFLFEAKRGKPGIDWDTYLVLFPYTQEDHYRYNSSMTKRSKEGSESLTNEDRFAKNKYDQAHRRKLIPKEFITQINWDTYFKETAFTPEDRKRYNFAANKKRTEGMESLTDEDLFAINKYQADLKRRKLKKKENEAN